MNNLFFLFFQKFDSNPEAMFDPTSDELRSRRKKGQICLGASPAAHYLYPPTPPYLFLYFIEYF